METHSRGFFCFQAYLFIHSSCVCVRFRDAHLTITSSSVNCLLYRFVSCDHLCWLLNHSDCTFHPRVPISKNTIWVTYWKCIIDSGVIYIFFLIFRKITWHQDFLQNEAHRRRYGGRRVRRLFSPQVSPHAQHFHWGSVARKRQNTQDQISVMQVSLTI